MNYNYQLILNATCLLALLSFSSCSPTFQYDVLVENRTNEVLSIAYKSDSDRRGTVEDVLLLNPQERKRIISTKNLETKGAELATSTEHCELVAEYVTASKLDGRTSTTSWCADNIRFEKVDIQQGEFTVIYTDNDF